MNRMIRNNLNITVLSKVLLIMLLDVLATATSFFMGLWFRYEFVFSDIAQYHLDGYLSTIGIWCGITVAVLFFKMRRSCKTRSIILPCFQLGFS